MARKRFFFVSREKNFKAQNAEQVRLIKRGEFDRKADDCPPFGSRILTLGPTRNVPPYSCGDNRGAGFQPAGDCGRLEAYPTVLPVSVSPPRQHGTLLARRASMLLAQDLFLRRQFTQVIKRTIADLGDNRRPCFHASFCQISAGR
jgi:hypothetical protein